MDGSSQKRPRLRPPPPSVSAASSHGQEFRRFLEARNQELGKTGAIIPANTRRAVAMPIGRDSDNNPMDARLCRAAFRDTLVRAIRYGVMELLSAYETRALRKPKRSESGPAREGAIVERPLKVVHPGRPSASKVAETRKGDSSAVKADDGGHLCYHIVFRALLAVAAIVRELQEKEKSPSI